MKIVLSALFLLSLVGFSQTRSISPPPSPGWLAEAAAPVATAPEAEEAAVGNGDEEAYCPMHWTCNFRNWYTSQAACVASCAGGFGCMLEYHCSPGCVCP